ncbi:outer membrane homotrimeric porin [Desulfovibrio sp. OttesenSCG-928-C14]|nr:outer membrane homotrimeric porin [Desulfovibrio sp. OttesenSCG-928-C14]
MKRLLILFAALVLCSFSSTPAAALEVAVKGDMHFAFIFKDKADYPKAGFDRGVDEQTFFARQRVRVSTAFIVSEDLKGVLTLHSGFINWGDEASGGIDGNRSTLNIREAYLDWRLGDSGLTLRPGLQLLWLPEAVSLSPVMNTAVAGVSAMYRFNEAASVNLAWARPWNNAGNESHDAFDLFLLTLPLTFDGLELTPWAEYSRLGRNSMDDQSPGGILTPLTKNYRNWTHNGSMWHLGLAAKYTGGDWIFAADFIYGGLESSGQGADPARNGGHALKTNGFFADFKASYDTGNGRLGLAAWYASGDDKGQTEKRGRHGHMPTLVSSANHEVGWGYGVSSYGFWGDTPIVYGGVALSQSGVGTAGLSLMWENFSFVENLTHTLRFLHYRGTNYAREGASSGMSPTYKSSGSFKYLCRDDKAYELNFDHRWQIEKGFSATLDFGAIYVDWKNRSDMAGSSWRLAIGLQYEF